MDLTAAGSGLLGGLLIGGAAAGLLLLNGRIAGISNIAAGVFSQQGSEWAWRVAFLLGMLTGGSALTLLRPHVFGTTPLASPLLIAVAGLLVGFGAQLANGCTSGHGVCGLGRRSLRSLIATLTFMMSGMVTVYVTGSLPGGLHGAG